MNQYKYKCDCPTIHKDISKYYYGITPKNKFQQSKIGPRELECRSCLPSLSKENKNLVRPYPHWRLGYGDIDNPVPRSHNLPTLAQLERPGGYTIVHRELYENENSINLCNLQLTGSVFIVNPFENEVAPSHVVYETNECIDSTGEKVKKYRCKPYTITRESRNYRYTLESDSKLIKVGASSYDDYLQKTGRKFKDRNYECFDNTKESDKKIKKNPYFIFKPNNPQFASQGGVSGGSRTARLKRNRLTNNGANFQSKFFKDPSKAIKKRRTDNTNCREIGWRRGKKTKCFDLINLHGGGDHKRRLKPARPHGFDVIVIEEKECSFKFIKIYNECCVDEDGNHKPSEIVNDGTHCGGKEMCKVTKACKVIKDQSYITINDALTRVRRRYSKKCLNCTRKLICKTRSIVPKFYPPLEGPPVPTICLPPINDLPDVILQKPPMVTVPQIVDRNPPVPCVPQVHNRAPPVSYIPGIRTFNPPLQCNPKLSETFKPPIDILPGVDDNRHPPLPWVPATKDIGNPPLPWIPNTKDLETLPLSCTPNINKIEHPSISCAPSINTMKPPFDSSAPNSQDIVYIRMKK